MLHTDEVMTALWDAKAVNAKRQGGLVRYVERVLQLQAQQQAQQQALSARPERPQAPSKPRVRAVIRKTLATA